MSETVPSRIAKYLPLVSFLTTYQDTEAILTFAEVEELLGWPLPQSALKRAWWAKAIQHVDVKAWADAGWKVERVDARQRRVTFTRQQAVPPSLPA